MLTFLLISLCLARDDSAVKDEETTVVSWYQFDVSNDLPRSYVLEIPNIKLYLSTDKGKTWQLYNTYSSTSEKFRVVTYKNGVYWVARQYVRYNGEVHPETSALKVYDKVKVDVAVVSQSSEVKTATTEPKTPSTPAVYESRRVKPSLFKRIKLRKYR